MSHACKLMLSDVGNEDCAWKLKSSSTNAKQLQANEVTDAHHEKAGHAGAPSHRMHNIEYLENTGLAHALESSDQN